MITLRPYQAALIDQAQASLQQGERPLLVSPTGSGKTVMFAWLAAHRQQRIFILVHRAELLAQVSNTLTAMEVEHGCIAPDRPNHKTRRVQVASVHTLVRRLADYIPPDLCIIDEAHHAIPSTTWGRILSCYPRAQRLGVTATPERLGGEGLADTFDRLLLGPSVASLIEIGALCPYRLYAPPATYTEGVHTRMGDFAKPELVAATDTPTITGDAVAHYRKHAHGKRALVFCISILHAQHVAQQFRTNGYAADVLDGTMEATIRREKIARFSSGQTTILTSCDLVGEGFDLPAIEVVIQLRPTRSLALHLQQVGRALRPFPGKEYALILDHAGNSQRLNAYPDDDFAWSLDGKAKRLANTAERAIQLRPCGQCFRPIRASFATCPHCGYVFQVVPRKVEEVAGELVEVNRLAIQRERKIEQAKAKDLADLLAIQKQRNYKPGWAFHVMKARLKKYAGV